MIVRVETSKRYLITLSKGQVFNQQTFEKLSPILYDRMTHCVYTKENLPVNSFDERLPLYSENWFTVPILEKGKAALSEVNEKLGIYIIFIELMFFQIENLSVLIFKRFGIRRLGFGFLYNIISRQA